ncbi:MAG: ABC transporter ATP-binding protein [Candidatus Competibacterales bacterium]
MARIELHHLHKRFDDFVAVKDTELTIEHGQFFVLLGPSGCGKTTTLRMIAGLELPTSGQIRLDGEDVTFLRAAKRDIAFVFQLFALYPHFNVYDNLAYPLRSQGTPRREIRSRVEEVARLLRIEGLLRQPVGRLAGGDRQRIALGRAIIRRPKAFLMDEPLGTLDAEFRALMCEELKQLHRRIEATTIYVTHDQVEAMAMGDGIAVMNHGEVLQWGTPFEIYHRPRDVFVASFIGTPPMNLLEAQGPLAPGSGALTVAGHAIPLAPDAGGVAGEKVILGVRPEHLRLASDGPLPGSVVEVEYLGAWQIVGADTPAGKVKFRAANTVRLSLGESIRLAFDPRRLVVFDGQSGLAVPSRGTEPRERAHG